MYEGSATTNYKSILDCGSKRLYLLGEGDNKSLTVKRGAFVELGVEALDGLHEAVLRESHAEVLEAHDESINASGFGLASVLERAEDDV